MLPAPHCSAIFGLRRAGLCLAQLLARRVDGIFLSDFEQGEIGPDLFRHACLLGLEGLVSKHKDRPYRDGAMEQVVQETFDNTAWVFASDDLCKSERIFPNTLAYNASDATLAVFVKRSSGGDFALSRAGSTIYSG